MRLIFISLLLAVGIPFAATSKAPSESEYDTTKVRKLYQDGDFEQAIRILDAGLKRPGLSHSDSVFIFKHLGVMYAASETTRERGKYYMVQLLNIEPTARIMDMYASDMIYMIFRNIQEEFETSRAKLERAQGHVAGNQGTALAADTARTSSTPPPKTGATETHKGSIRPWLIGGTVVLAVGVGVAVFFLNDEKTVETKHQTVD